MSSTGSTVSNRLLKNVYVLRHVQFKVYYDTFLEEVSKNMTSAGRDAYACPEHGQLIFSVSATEFMCCETEL